MAGSRLELLISLARADDSSEGYLTVGLLLAIAREARVGEPDALGRMIWPQYPEYVHWDDRRMLHEAWKRYLVAKHPS